MSFDQAATLGQILATKLSVAELGLLIETLMDEETCITLLAALRVEWKRRCATMPPPPRS